MAVFLMENGVLSMGNKTPVTILQETLQRKGINPHYELIYNGVGTMDPIFKYQVSASGFTAIGDGKSKKEAKHDAAAALLRRMQVGSDCSEIQEMDIASPYSGAIKQNFVGMLDEICVNNKIPFPVFVPISEDGPPHARIFTMQCKLSTCTETAVARTKKQAKHMVAQQMVNRIAQIMGNKFIPVVEKNSEPEDLPLGSLNLKAIENGNYRHDFSIPIAEFHNVFYKSEEFLVPPTFSDLALETEEFYDNLESPKEFLNGVVSGLEGLTNTILISKQALNEVFQEIEKDCQMFVWGQEEEEVEDDSSDDDDSVCGGSHPLEEFDMGVEKEKSSASNCNDALCSSQKVENSNLRSVDDKQLVGNRLLEESDVGDEGKKMPSAPSALNPNDELCPSQEVESSTLQSVGVEELVKCSIQFERDLHLDSTFVSPKFSFLSVECPQGKWTFRGVGATIEQAEKIAAAQALKFLRVMSIPSGPKEMVEES